MSKPRLVSFGAALLDEKQEPLREKILSLSAGQLTRPVYVNTVFGVHSGHQVQSNIRAWFLLFDFHRVYLYDDPMTSDTARIDSVVRYIIDDYPFKPFELLAVYLEQNPFRFFYRLETLDLLLLFWAYDHPGKVIVLDLVTGEVRACEAQIHPQQRAERDPITSRTDLASPFAERSLDLKDQLAGSAFRATSFPGFDDLIPSELSIIRNQRNVMSEASVPESVTRVAWRRGTRETFCGAKSFQPKEALLVARCEAIERSHVVYPYFDDPPVYGTYSELTNVAIDPKSLFFRVAPPGRSSPPYENYNDSTPMYWTWAFDILAGKPYLVPAQDVWFNTDIFPEETICIGSTTSGCAIGNSLEEASLFAILETIERDAFLTTWYLRRTCDQIDPESVRFEPFQLLWVRLRSVFPNYSFHLFDITADTAIPAVSIVALRERGNGPRTLHTAAARPVAERALFAALKDVAGELRSEMQPTRRQYCMQFLEKPELLRSPDDHRDFYGLDESFERLSFIDFESDPKLDVDKLNRRSIVTPQDSYNLRELVEEIVRHLNGLGIKVLLKDITHPLFRRHDFSCVKAIIPGLYPIWFGYRGARFSLTDRFQGLAQRFTARKIQDEREVHLEVHPLS